MTSKEIAEKYVYGKHSCLTDNEEIKELIKDIETYSENKVLNINNFMRNYLISEIEKYKKYKTIYGWITKQFKYTYQGQITALKNTFLVLESEYNK